MKKRKPSFVTKRFRATLERMPSRLNWIIVRLPFDAVKLWGVRGRLNVQGAINGFAFRTSLFPNGSGGHYLLVNKTMQRGGNCIAGRVAAFEVTLDSEKRVVEEPAELRHALGKNRSFRRWYEQLNQSSRNEIAKWVGEPKSAAARIRRSEQMAERLFETMEAERELPPLLQVALARDSRAREGWERMSLSRRRSHLLGIFYYRTPDGRANRIAKMLADAASIMENNQ